MTPGCTSVTNFYDALVNCYLEITGFFDLYFLVFMKKIIVLWVERMFACDINPILKFGEWQTVISNAHLILEILFMYFFCVFSLAHSTNMQTFKIFSSIISFKWLNYEIVNLLQLKLEHDLRQSRIPTIFAIVSVFAL